VRKVDNLPHSCADVKKSGGLNLLEPCGPVQACNGTALPLDISNKYQIILMMRKAISQHEVNLDC
jgi:hypothetical protein